MGARGQKWKALAMAGGLLEVADARSAWAGCGDLREPELRELQAQQRVQRLEREVLVSFHQITARRRDPIGLARISSELDAMDFDFDLTSLAVDGILWERDRCFAEAGARSGSRPEWAGQERRLSGPALSGRVPAGRSPAGL